MIHAERIKQPMQTVSKWAKTLNLAEELQSGNDKYIQRIKRKYTDTESMKRKSQRDTKTLKKKNQMETLELKNTKIKIKNSLDGFNARVKKKKESVNMKIDHIK